MIDRRGLMKVAAGGTAFAFLPFAGQRHVASGQEANQVTIEWRKPQTLNPLFSTAGFEQQVERAIFGALVHMSGDLEPTPDLAESVDINDDATEFVFNLRKEAMFNDGKPLTAADVMFTFERALDGRTGSFWTGRLQGIKGAPEFGDQSADAVEGLEIVDDHTFKITLSNPDAAFLPILADFSGLGILPKHILEDVAPDQLQGHNFSLNPTVGAGPYSFVQYQSDQFVELQANPNYWGEAPAVERIFLRILQPEIAVAELESGTIDLVSISLDNIERLEANDAITVVSIESPSMDSISLNLDLEYFQDKRLRQAMMYGINRAGIAEQIYGGNAIVRNSPIFGPDWMGVPEGLNEYAYDPDKARQLVKESGWDENRTVEMMYNPSSTSTFTNMVPIIQSQLAEIGIKINLLQLDAAGINLKLTTDHDYEIYIGGGGVYGADPNISSKYYLSNSFTPGGANSVWYANEEVDALYQQGREAGSLEDRKAVYTTLAQLLNEELPSIFLWSPNTNFAYSNRLQGFSPPRYVDNRLWNAEEWSVSE